MPEHPETYVPTDLVRAELQRIVDGDHTEDCIEGHPTCGCHVRIAQALLEMLETRSYTLENLL